MMSFISTLNPLSDQQQQHQQQDSACRPSALVDSSTTHGNDRLFSNHDSFDMSASSTDAAVTASDYRAGSTADQSRPFRAGTHFGTGKMLGEESPLLEDSKHMAHVVSDDGSHLTLLGRVGASFASTLQAILSAILLPGRYLIACFYDEQGRFSAWMPVRRLTKTFSKGSKGKSAHTNSDAKQASNHKRGGKRVTRDSSARSSLHMAEYDMDDEKTSRTYDKNDSPSRHTRSKSSQSSSDEKDSARPNRSIRIKVLNDESLRNRKQRRLGSDASQEPSLTVSNIKSPTSPTSLIRLEGYPRTPAPPRPLVPRRQPSYTSLVQPFASPKKTLVIDLDETLIHSMVKGGRMSTGHMVEVRIKLNTPGGAGGSVMGPQVPILYYVHKRPHCDEFLRKVSKWYNLVAFTASVQEYADPVVDWLELERKYFSARYYRQHCTFRNGAYIKDLSQVEPDLSRVMILDNSPMSYIFHEDNAIPIEGWISDPSDNDLLHLIPLLEALQHTTDVRALLALRLGESTA